MTTTEIVTVDLDKELKDAVCRMKRGVSRVPEPIANVFYDLCRAEPRAKQKPLGHYPETAIAFAGEGAKWEDVTRPMAVLKGALWNRFYAPRLPSLMEIVSREKEANAMQDHATHQLLRSTRPDAVDAFIDACDVQMAETRLARALAVQIKYSGRAD